MKAGETTVKDLLEADKLYVVPKYQRRYAWNRQDWAQLWRAVDRQYSAQVQGDAASHFLGSFVIAQRQAFPTDAPNFDVIDGQQRLTTLLVLLAALRDAMPEGQLVRERVDSFIRNKFESGEFRFKIRPGDDDRANVYSILDGQPEGSGGLPLSAYNYFASVLGDMAEGPGLDHALMLKSATARLEVVQILTGPGDNAHRIFQTLNSTGKELTAVDLLRNHFFMLLRRHLDEAYEDIWRPLQAAVGVRFPAFLWIDLVTRPGLESVPNQPDRIYAEWQAILDPLAGDEAGVMAELVTLKSRADNFLALLSSATGETAIDGRLRRLNEWGTAVHLPLTFAILELWRARKADSQRTANALANVESFLVRRMLAGVPTNNLNRIFTTSVGQLQLPAYAQADVDIAVHRILSQPGKYWPSDEALIRDGLTGPFYERQRGLQRQFILRRLEEAMAKLYAPDWGYCNFTIEHVLPQKATQWWLDHLAQSGEQEPAQAHEELRHTIGNLTLTCENPELGQMAFEEKCAVYTSDILKMNEGIAACTQWGREEILARGQQLLELATTLWVAPIPAEKLDEHALATEIRTTIEGLTVGRWIDIASLAEFLDADEDAVERAMALLGMDSIADVVLDADGALRSDQLTSGRRERAVARLIEAGVIQAESELPASSELKVSAIDLLSSVGE